MNGITNKSILIDILGFFREFFGTGIIKDNNDEKNFREWEKENNISYTYIEKLERTIIHTYNKIKKAKKEITVDERPSKAEVNTIEKINGGREIGE